MTWGLPCGPLRGSQRVRLLGVDRRRHRERLAGTTQPGRGDRFHPDWVTGFTGIRNAAVAMATLALDPEWLRPDTERRTRILLSKLRDPQLRAQLDDQLHASIDAAAHDRA